jgi:HNH endonuclease
MKRWRRVAKDLSRKPRTGDYKKWKPALAEEGEYRCVYCAIPDGLMGGEFCFHVEHFEPKSKAPHLRDDWANLFYSCPICNVFKSDDWPDRSLPHAYPDPSEFDYAEFLVMAEDGTVSGTSVASRYLVERLFLNRPQLRLERRQDFLQDRSTSLRLEVKSLATAVVATQHIDAPTLILRAFECVDRIASVMESLRDVRAYESTDVRRAPK